MKGVYYKAVRITYGPLFRILKPDALPHRVFALLTRAVTGHAFYLQGLR